MPLSIYMYPVPRPILPTNHKVKINHVFLVFHSCKVIHNTAKSKNGLCVLFLDVQIPSEEVLKWVSLPIITFWPPTSCCHSLIFDELRDSTVDGMTRLLPVAMGAVEGEKKIQADSMRYLSDLMMH